MTAHRVLLVDPYGDASPRGNSVSAARLASALRGAGHDVLRVVAMETTLSAATRATRAFAPGLVHAVHAFRAAHLGRELAARLGLPLVVSFRGTDAEAGLEHR